MRLMSDMVSARRGWIEEQRRSLWSGLGLGLPRDGMGCATRRSRGRVEACWRRRIGADKEGESKGRFGIALLYSAYSLQPTT